MMAFSVKDPEEIIAEYEEAKRLAKIAAAIDASLPPLQHSPGNCPNCGLCIVEQDGAKFDEGELIYSCPRCGHKTKEQELAQI